jgi:hypothetical protein
MKHELLLSMSCSRPIDFEEADRARSCKKKITDGTAEMEDHTHLDHESEAVKTRHHSILDYAVRSFS